MTNEPISPQEQGMTKLVPRNIQAMLDRRAEEYRRRSAPERIADAVTAFAGSMKFVLLHLLLFGGWIIINLPAVPGPKFDPSFVVLAMFASVEAIFLSTFVLISQNRMAALEDKRSELSLHVGLLAEHEITRLVILVAAMSDKMGLSEAQDPSLAELKKDIAPEKVLDVIETRTEAKSVTNP